MKYYRFSPLVELFLLDNTYLRHLVAMDTNDLTFEPFVQRAPPVINYPCTYAASTAQHSMGIFTKWRIFEKPEVALERELEDNPTYPFQQLDPSDQHPDASADLEVDQFDSPGSYWYTCYTLFAMGNGLV